MNLIETIRLALAAIWAHKLRSSLTLLGMVIGVSAVVVIASLIRGFNLYVDEKIAGIGAQYFTIDRFSLDDFRSLDTITAAMRRNPPLKMDESAYLRAHATLIDELGVRAKATARSVKRGNLSLAGIAVDGATANIAGVEKLEIAEGRFFTESENESAQRLALIGADVADKLFSSQTVVGQELKISGLPYRVVGLARAKGTVFGVPQDAFITVPLKTYAKDFGPPGRQRAIYFSATAKSDAVFNDAVEEARQLMRLLRRLGRGDKDDFGIFTPGAITEARDQVFGPLYVIAIAVPSIAIFISAVVIMNIMLVSVAERTREIGLRRAVGARRADIISQFLVESVTLSTIGGGIGVALAWLAGQMLTRFLFQAPVSATAVVIALAVSAGAGLLAGVAPARKAARLDPVIALGAE